MTDASDLAENPSHAELEFPEIESHADDPIVSNKLENQVLDNSTETQEDFEADALAETSNMDVRCRQMILVRVKPAETTLKLTIRINQNQ